MQWMKLHWRQLCTLGCAAAVFWELHTGKLTPDEASALGSALALLGIQLPPFVLRKPEALGNKSEMH